VTRLAAAFLTLAAIPHVVLGISALAGTDRLEENARQVETSPIGGELYISLEAFGVIIAGVGLLELVAAWFLYARGESARIFGLIAGYLALGVVFWTLPLFRWASVATLFLLFASAYVLTYQVGKPES
jgi:hypothetical protein